jgi:geranylgeranyl diphosphate synthase type II
MEQILALREELEKALNDLHLPEQPAKLYQPVRYTLENGGKRMRPVLVLLGCKLFSEDISNAIHPALGIELFHNFTLIHDDIMDEAPVRRGKPSVYEQWDSNVAILSGDAVFIKAYQELLRTDKNVILPILDLFNKTALEICEGQQLDMDFEQRNDVSIDDYLHMITLKTAVLLGASLKIGALAGGASENQAQALYDFGLNCGIAFQLQDDILDVFGESKKVGKQKGGDILANKKTFLLLKAQELSSGQIENDLNDWISSSNSGPDKVAGVTSIYNQLNVRELAEERMWNYFNTGIAALEKLDADEKWKSILLDFSRSLMHRES